MNPTNNRCLLLYLDLDELRLLRHIPGTSRHDLYHRLFQLLLFHLGELRRLQTNKQTTHPPFNPTLGLPYHTNTKICTACLAKKKSYRTKKKFRPTSAQSKVDTSYFVFLPACLFTMENFQGEGYFSAAPLFLSLLLIFLPHVQYIRNRGVRHTRIPPWTQWKPLDDIYSGTVTTVVSTKTHFIPGIFCQVRELDIDGHNLSPFEERRENFKGVPFFLPQAL